MSRITVFVSLVLLTIGVEAQNDTLSNKQITTQQPKQTNLKRTLLPVVELGFYSTSAIVLWNAWYKGYDHSSFHWFNDNAEWLQMDKLSHCNTSYWLTKRNFYLHRWAGYSEAQARWISAGESLLAMGSIEYFDGLSAEWGASWGDLAANTSGIALFTIQNITKTEDLFQLKISYWPSEYRAMRPSVLGSNMAEGFIKDYNGQTHWFSITPAEAGCSFMPKWLQISVGYGATGMTGGMQNALNTVPDWQRKRCFYFAPDCNLAAIHTRKRWVKFLLNSLQMLKFPTPALEITDSGLHWWWIKF